MLIHLLTSGIREREQRKDRHTVLREYEQTEKSGVVDGGARREKWRED